MRVDGLKWAACLSILIVACFSAPLVWSCEPRSELETVYCQLLGKGAQLPALNDFRRNSPKVQRLLLSRPASKAGIALPSLPKRQAVIKPAISTSSVPSISTSSVPSISTFFVSSPSPSISVSTPISTSRGVAGANESDACQLLPEVIRCAHGDYRLVLNQPNHRLQPGSLTDANRLLLSPYAPGAEIEAEYLSASYRQYIEKMLTIGLGGSTMSYSKFYYTWQESRAQKQNVPDRFSAMFEYLKRDKQALAVKPRYDHELPEALSWCQPLSNELWTCDNKHRNWVFQR